MLRRSAESYSWVPKCALTRVSRGSSGTQCLPLPYSASPLQQLAANVVSRGEVMGLSSGDKAFVAKRERRARYWPFAGVGSLLLLAAYGAWLWVKTPNLINPWQVLEALEAGTLPESTMGVMVVMLPIVMATFLVFAFAMVLLLFVAFYNERRLIRLIVELESDSLDREMKGSSKASATSSSEE